jgi:plasmid stabilization system protein ParE
MRWPNRFGRRSRGEPTLPREPLPEFFATDGRGSRRNGRMAARPGRGGGGGRELLTTVLAAGERLVGHPLLGRRRPDLLPKPYRFWSIPRWRLLLVYDPTTNPATILRVLNTAQDLPPLLADLWEPPGRAGGLSAVRRGISCVESTTCVCRSSLIAIVQSAQRRRVWNILSSQ